MAISLNREELRRTIEMAVRKADSGNYSQEWFDRSEHIAECPSQSFVAMLGEAMLAKATNSNVDALSVKARSGPRGHSARSVVKPLVEASSKLGFDLGVTGREPLNNQPFFHPVRVDHIQVATLKVPARPYLRSLINYLTELNGAASGEATEALAAFIASRRTRFTGEVERSFDTSLPGSVHKIAPHLNDYVTLETESGRRGQAFAAAALDCIYPLVRLGQVHHPDGIDVEAWESSKPQGTPRVACQVKQKTVGLDTLEDLAKLARQQDIPVALLIAIGTRQTEIDREQVATLGTSLGVTAIAITSVREVLDLVTAFSRHPQNRSGSHLSKAMLVRLDEIGADPAGITELAETLKRNLAPVT